VTSPALCAHFHLVTERAGRAAAKATGQLEYPVERRGAPGGPLRAAESDGNDIDVQGIHVWV
jgi:hypothetical protein